MKYIIIVLLLYFPFLSNGQSRRYPILDTVKVELLKTNDSIPKYRIRRVIINSDSSEISTAPTIAVGQSELINALKNQVHEISINYSKQVIEILSGLPLKAMINRYIQGAIHAPDTSLLVALNKEFPLEEGEYVALNTALGSNNKTTWRITLNKKDNYFYVQTPLDMQAIYITSQLHFRVGVEFDFFKIDEGTWMSLNGYILKKKD